MNSDIGYTLEQIHELIEINKLDEARAMLKPILETDKDNPDVWWLYAHAVDDAETARLALNNVLRLDSDYPDVQHLLSQLDKQRSDPDLLEDAVFTKEPSFLPVAPPTLPGLSQSSINDDELDFPDDFEDEDEESPFSSRLLVIATAIGLLLLIGALVIVIGRPFANQGNQAAATNTPSSLVISENPTTVATSPALMQNTALPVETAESNPIQQIPDEISVALVNDLQSFDISKDDISVASTNLGNTLIVDVCTQVGAELREKLPQVMDVLARNNTIYDQSIESIGTRMISCDTNTPILAIGVSLADAIGYANGNLTDEEFQAGWKPIG